MKNQTKRGRPALEVALPKASKFTVNDIVAANPHITCRLTVYTKRDDLVKNKVIRLTGETVRTEGVGKPLDVYQTMKSYRLSRAAKAAAKTRAAKAKVPTVDVVSAPAPVAA